MLRSKTNLIIISFLSILLYSCSSDDDKVIEPTEPVKEKDTYALLTAVKGGTFNYSLYLQTMDNLTKTKDLDNKNATEIVAETVTGVYQYDGNFYTNLYFTPERIEKWSLNEKQELTKQGSISLGELGYQGNVYFKDKNTAFVGGPAGTKIAIFNPETMTKTGYIDYSSVSRIGEVTNYPNQGDKINIQAPSEMIVSGNYLYIGFCFLKDLQTYTPASPTADILVVDLTKIDPNSADNSNAIVKWISNDKGNSVGSWNSGFGAKFMITDEKNDIYLLSHNYWGAVNVGKPACILRIKSGETDFDADYYFDLETVSRGVGNPVMNLEYAGNGIFFATSNDITAINPDDPYSYYQDPIAQWYKFDLHDKTATKVNDEYTQGSYASCIYFEDDKAYIPFKTKTKSYIKEVNINTLESKDIITTAGIPRVFKLK
ncbi:DUF4374 domain-containing protein [Aquimarina aquimarini]|uniref:DUF4374 domain-containing protein n=1 Tax=Aquimarina aquimarini TaxID=1191734 RepID=UPI001F364B51|nr:DUF4374 domain-containing protein [Aquimarina aquimarini]